MKKVNIGKSNYNAVEYAQLNHCRIEHWEVIEIFSALLNKFYWHMRTLTKK